MREANARICHTSHTAPCSETMTGTLGLLIALSLHSFIEGLAIGVQDTKAGVKYLKFSYQINGMFNICINTCF